MLASINEQRCRKRYDLANLVLYATRHVIQTTAFPHHNVDMIELKH